MTASIDFTQTTAYNLLARKEAKRELAKLFKKSGGTIHRVVHNSTYSSFTIAFGDELSDVVTFDLFLFHDGKQRYGIGGYGISSIEDVAKNVLLSIDGLCKSIKTKTVTRSVTSHYIGGI